MQNKYVFINKKIHDIVKNVTICLHFFFLISHFRKAPDHADYHLVKESFFFV